MQHPEKSLYFQGRFQSEAGASGIDQRRLDLVRVAGRFESLRPGQWIALFDSSGYLEVDGQALGSGTLTLAPWSRVEGKLIRQGADVTGQTIRCVCFHSKGKGRIAFFQEKQTGDGGAFAFDQLPAGNVGICRISARAGGMQNTSAALLPGKTTSVTAGGVGGVVVGKLDIPMGLVGERKWECYGQIHTFEEGPTPPMPDDVKNGTAEKRDKWMGTYLKTDAGKAYTAASDRVRAGYRGYTMEIESDGTYRIEDVLPGDYEADIALYPSPRDPGADNWTDRLAVGHAKRFTVPASSGDQGSNQCRFPLIVMLAAPVVAVGKAAPPFTAPTLDGKKLSLSDFKGHYILMDFWSTWCGPCIEEMPYIKAVYNAYGRDGRLLKSLASTLDEKREEAKRFVDKNQMVWNQAWVGDDVGKRIVECYIPSGGIPRILLIGPDGKVIVIIRGPEIKAAGCEGTWAEVKTSAGW